MESSLSKGTCILSAFNSKLMPPFHYLTCIYGFSFWQESFTQSICWNIFINSLEKVGNWYFLGLTFSYCQVFQTAFPPSFCLISRTEQMKKIFFLELVCLSGILFHILLKLSKNMIKSLLLYVLHNEDNYFKDGAC